MKVIRSPHFLPMRGAAHEAAHAVAALVMGLEVTEVRIDRPGIGTSGWCVTPLDGRDPSTADVITTLAAGLADGGSGSTDFDEWPPPWPVCDGRGDQGRVHLLVRLLGITEPIYRDLLALTEDLVASPEFQAGYRRLALALKDNEVLDREEIRRIAAPYLPTDEKELSRAA